MLPWFLGMPDKTRPEQQDLEPIALDMLAYVAGGAADEYRMELRAPIGSSGEQIVASKNGSGPLNRLAGLRDANICLASIAKGRPQPSQEEANACWSAMSKSWDFVREDK